VEVKGVSGSEAQILLTANELRAATVDPLWSLAVVTSALSAPELYEFEAAAVVAAASPYVYRVDLRK
jgi:hypothetical protein